MRITNKVMQNNALTNINRNKTLQDTLNTQLATGKKVARPSEDPVVAIRALRLRSDVSQVSQYVDKNVSDARSWLELTESAVKTTVAVVKDMIKQCEKGSSDTLTTEDRKIIIDSLKELRNEVYATGDADYAGRYIFTGYRTDTSLSFGEDTTQKFTVTELFNENDITKETYIDTANLTEIDEANYAQGGDAAIVEQDIASMDYYRVRLSYNNLDAGQTLQSLSIGGTDYAVTTMEDTDAAFNEAATNPDAVVFIPSTGEVLFGANMYEAIKNHDGDIQVSYDKTDWLSTDLRPQHYFYCTSQDEEGNTIEYNPDYLTDNSISQKIAYQVGFNQEIQVNTYAEEIFQHDIGRDVDELIQYANELTAAEEVLVKLEGMAKDTDSYSEDEIALINKDLAAADKAVTLMKSQLQEKFSHYITKMQSYLDDTDEALTVVGNRGAKLDLIENRLTDQKTTFRTLQSENEDADETEVAVLLSSAQVSYEAALMATSEMIQKTLLNYL
ncbi:MAG: hypothetical protein IJZ00_02175 [Lachnospiraceae bacterium]|nr:hypothetical protein [Lachnospiraceae bacterium]